MLSTHLYLPTNTRLPKILRISSNLVHCSSLRRPFVRVLALPSFVPGEQPARARGGQWGGGRGVRRHRLVPTASPRATTLRAAPDPDHASAASLHECHTSQWHNLFRITLNAVCSAAARRPLGGRSAAGGEGAHARRAHMGRRRPTTGLYHKPSNGFMYSPAYGVSGRPSKPGTMRPLEAAHRPSMPIIASRPAQRGARRRDREGR